MTRYKATPEGVLPFTAEEEAQADLDAAHIASVKAAEARTKYQRDRAAEYPAIGDQLDALFKAGVFPADMAATIQAVKDKYPKG
jgi:hypothetical protein